MKKLLKFKPTVPTFMVALLTLTAVQGSAPDRLGRYDFSYESRGDLRAKPAQVFDDGKSTYFQFRAGEALPVIFAATANGPQLLVPVVEGPYVRVSAVSGSFTLRAGQSTSQVSYLGTGRETVSPEQAVPAPATKQVAMARLLAAAGQVQGLPPEMTAPAPRIEFNVNSYATPLKGDRVEWTTTEVPSPVSGVPFVKGKGSAGPQATRQVRDLAKTLITAKRIVVTGIDDRSYAEGLAEQRAQAIVDLLVGAGVPRDRISVKSSAQPLEGEDQTVVTGAQILSYSSHTIRQPEAAPVMAQAGPLPIPGRPRDDALTQLVKQVGAGAVTPAAAIEQIRSNRTATPDVGRASTISWDVLASDGNVGAMLTRWGKASGWRVIVKDAPEVVIHGDAVVERPTFLQAADYAITQAKAAGFAIKATSYSNQVLLITAGESK